MIRDVDPKTMPPRDRETILRYYWVAHVGRCSEANLLDVAANGLGWTNDLAYLELVRRRSLDS